LTAKVLTREGIDDLLAALAAAGYEVIGPTVHEAAIVYDRVSGTGDLPVGVGDEQSDGTYRLRDRADEALFGYVVGPQSWKRYLFPPRSTLLTIRRVNGELAFDAPEPPKRRYAFFGVRACELAAIEIQDTVFLGSGQIDRTYRDNRNELFTVGVNCAVAGGTCFCVSMGTGPRCTTGYDLVLTEVLEEGRHEFVVDSGSEAGATFIEQVGGRPATESDFGRVDAIVANTSAHMGRELDTTGIKEMLQGNRDNRHWDDVAARCLTCTNCTLVCPTCFCSTTEDDAALDGITASRQRRWDSCFTLEFTALHGSPVRASVKSRYRQWMTHKLAGWYDQFGTSGCVGCGRCITWCPVGIDITAEIAAFRAGLEVPA